MILDKVDVGHHLPKEFEVIPTFQRMRAQRL